MFNVGDKVVYPMHGAGIIEAIENREILGKVKKYYILRMPIGDMKLMIPVSTVEEAGLRQVVDADTVQLVLEKLRQKRTFSSANWNRRYRANLRNSRPATSSPLLKSSQPCRSGQKGLSPERKMLDTARQILVSGWPWRGILIRTEP